MRQQKLTKTDPLKFRSILRLKIQSCIIPKTDGILKISNEFHNMTKDLSITHNTLKDLIIIIYIYIGNKINNIASIPEEVGDGGA